MKALIAVALIPTYAVAFTPIGRAINVDVKPSLSSLLMATTTSSSDVNSNSSTNSNTKFSPVFDFTSTADQKAKAVASFERIDDAIMGGISLSALKDVKDENYASWSGVCRTDGGGFCGMRTLPFTEPLMNAVDQDGVYVQCQLASDDEPERRVWKMTVRTDTSRGEQVYQAMFDLTNENSNGEGDEGMAKVKVPFSSFKMVRGPRLVPDGPPLDVSGGLYQLGMTMSKFQMGMNTTELENFRPGYFELQIQQIGFYKDDVTAAVAVAVAPDTLSKEEVAKRRPLPLKIMLPILKLFFSEKANRRKSAMNILRQKRNMSRGKAILYGIKSRRKSIGLIPSVFKTASILSVDAARAIFFTLLKVCLFKPLVLVRSAIRSGKKALGMNVKTKVNTPAE